MDAEPNYDPPPGYTETTDDGRINIDLDSKLARTLANFVPDPPAYSAATNSSQHVFSRRSWKIRLNIVIQVVGSRGDVQPFIALGQELQTYGHRVRIATHDCFASFVAESHLEFFPIGGDPHDLMAYMVKNPGLLPSMKSLREGDIQRKRVMVEKMLNGCWKSCTESAPGEENPFVADAIIANPPSFAHVHCAQALGVPLHIMFTMPWSSTRSFPHPLANLNGAQLDPGVMNYISYGVVEWMTWQGLGDVINAFRDSLDLERIPSSVGPKLAEALQVPFTYCWSPALVPKPADWPSHIDVCGFFFRDTPQYSPTAEIEKFLYSGPQPVYIGFGSIVIDDAAAMTNLLVEAVRMSGVRAIISRGWSKLGSNLDVSGNDFNDILFIDDCPHEWLFQHVSLVVHHGGAGTTACGLRNACPTVVVPFFGDQAFWGGMIATAQAGSSPIPHKFMTASNLSSAMTFCLQPSTRSSARAISAKMNTERGVQVAVQSFHANLPFDTLQCEILDDRPAVWLYTRGKSEIRLSSIAAQTLMQEGRIRQKDLRPYQSKPFIISNPRWDPVTSISSSGLSTIRGMSTSAVGLIASPYMAVQEAAPSDSAIKTTGLAVAGIGKSFGKFNAHLFRGMIIDVPFAAAEGLRAVPKLYGEDVQSHGEVTDAVSGFTIAGKTFAHGMADGISGLFVEPVQGVRAEGAVGFAKGMGKGVIGFASKTTSAAIGIVAYPGQGLYKSVSGLLRLGTRKKIAAQRLAEGASLARTEDPKIKATIMSAFDQLTA